MTTPSTPMQLISQKSQESLLEFCRQTVQASFKTVELRQRFELVDKEYIRENRMQDQDVQARAANARGDKRKIADAVIPIVEPQCDTAVTYLSSVFLTGSPIFGVVSPPEFDDQARAMEAVISDNATFGGWNRQLLMAFGDGIKYNFAACEVDWCRKKIWTPTTNSQFSKTLAEPKETWWEGNKITRLDPYNTFFDPRVPLTMQHEMGEFCGYSELLPRIALVERLASYSYRMNYMKALSEQSTSPYMQDLYYIPQVFTENFSYTKLQGIMDWNAWAFQGGGKPDIRLKYKNIYTLVTRYIRMIPSEYDINVPANKQVQIWKVITVNDCHIVYMERMTNAHGYLPIFFMQPNEDGLNLQTKSFAQKQIPLQDLASSLANLRLAGRRKMIADRIFYDPSRIREADINSENPAAKIPVRSSSYGQPLEKAFHAVPFRDEYNQSIMQDVREVQSYADHVSGQNKAQQGQFVKGNKTKTEYEDTQNKSSGRQQKMAILIEAQFFTPVKHTLKLNVLQYQQPAEYTNPADKKTYKINPIDLRKAAMVFKVSDGLLPSDKIIEGSTLEVAIQATATSPQLAEEYSAGKMFVHLMNTRGVDLSPYKYTPEEIQQRQQHELAVIKAQGEAAAAGKQQPVQGPLANGAQA